jgi:hypothetical protein
MTAQTVPIAGLVYEEVPTIDENADYTEADRRRLVDDPAQAHVVTSRVAGADDMHKVVIDLDLPAALVPSTTEGHFHLYVDKAMSGDAYFRLLDALVDAGLVEAGFASASRARGHTAVRLPWIKKGGAA